MNGTDDGLCTYHASVPMERRSTHARRIEVVERGGPDFAERAALWSEVIENVGGQLSTAGFCTKAPA